MDTIHRPLFVFHQNKLLLANDYGFVSSAQLSLPNEYIRHQASFHFQQTYDVIELTQFIEYPGHSWFSLKGLLSHVQEEQFYLIGRAKQLLEWSKSHRYCGECGHLTEKLLDEYCMKCTDCGRVFYPRIAPVVMVSVTDGEYILLARSPDFHPGIYSVIAGFVEPGETLEQAAHREVFEETALQISDLRYFGSQPWPFPNSLMVGYNAQYAGGDITPCPKEIEDAQFFHYKSLPKLFTGRPVLSQKLILHFWERFQR